MEQINEEINNTEFAEKKRNGFITFWLWLGIIANIILAPLTITLLYYNFGFYLPYADFSTPLYLLCATVVITAILCISGNVMLLKWKKRGYYLNFAAAVITVIMTYVCNTMIQEAFQAVEIFVDFTRDNARSIWTSFLPVMILGAILKIKKNGVSCWSQLE